jgi:hypothetical protein
MPIIELTHIYTERILTEQTHMCSDGMHPIQGGSDISGPLSKPHPHIKKSYFLLIFLRRPSQLFVEE